MSVLKHLQSLVDGITFHRLVFILLCFLLQAGKSFFKGLHVGQNELSLNNVNIAGRIDLSVNMHNIVIRKSPDNLANRICLTNIRQELVARPLPFRGTFHNSRNVNERDRRRDDLRRIEHLRQTFQACVR